jgi:predicted porin
MKQLKLAGALSCAGLAFACQHASAQSSVTLYGVADVSVRYLTNANAANDNRLYMTNGAITNSRFGMRGTEDLGGGYSAIFKLESGINLQDGTGSSRLFNRAAYVGLSSPYGTVTLGRQMTPLFDALGNTYDPLTVGNYFENAWQAVALGSGLYADNAVKYVGSFAGLSIDAMYSFGTDTTSTGPGGFSGQIPGHMGAGSMYGVTLSYTIGQLSFGGGVQQTSDNSNRKQTTFNANAVYTFSTVGLYLGYLHSKDDTGFVDFTLAQQPIAASIDDLKNTGRTDDGPYTGVTWQLTPALRLTGAFYYDHMKNASIGDGLLGSGNRYTGVALAEYSLSKRTEVYGTVDFNKVTGAGTVELPGRSNQTGIAIGLRNIF